MKTINTILACAFASLAFSSCSGPEDKNIIEELTLDEFIDRYGFEIKVSEIHIGGRMRFSSSHTFEMPEAIGHYWRPSAKPAHDGIARFDDMKMTIIKGMPHEDIPSESEYVYKYVDEKQRQINGRLHDLDNLPYMSDL